LDEMNSTGSLNDSASVIPTPPVRKYSVLFTNYLGLIYLTIQEPTLWLLASISFFILMPMICTVLFLPAIIQTFGPTPLLSNLYSSGPFLLAVILLNINAWHSDLTNERPYHIIGMASIGIFGYLLLLLSTLLKWSGVIQFIFLSVAVAGGWSAMTPFQAWVSQSVKGHKASGIAMINSLGSIAGYVGPTIQASLKTKFDTYIWGMMVLAGCLVIASTLIYFTNRKINKQSAVPTGSRTKYQPLTPV